MQPAALTSRRCPQFFTLDVVPHYDLYKEEEIDRSFHFDIALRGRDSDEEQWTLLSSARRYRRLFCKFGRKDCFGIAVLHQISIPYAFYRVDFSVPHQRIDFVSSADFRFKYVRTHFSFYELALRYTLIFITLWRLYSFHAACRSAGSGLLPLLDSSLMAEQRVTYLLLLTTLLNNDPLYLFAVVNGGWTSHLLAAVFTMAFIASLLLFMITMADLSALPAGRRPELSSRCGPAARPTPPPPTRRSPRPPSPPPVQLPPPESGSHPRHVVRHRGRLPPHTRQAGRRRHLRRGRQ